MMAHVLAKDLRDAVLQAAVQGKLTRQFEEDGTAQELLMQIKAEKEKLIKKKIIKREKPADLTREVPFDVPSNWSWVRLLEILELPPTNGKSVKSVDRVTGIKNLTLTATTSGHFIPEAFKYVELDEKTAMRYWLHPGDLLIQRSNSRELVGTSCIFDGNENEYIYPDLMMRMRVMRFVNLNYIDYVLKSPYVKMYYSHRASGTSDSMPKINQKIVTNTLIPLPPLAEQHRIVARIEEMMKVIDDYEVIENELSMLKSQFPNEMKDAVLKSAMDGALTNSTPSEWKVRRLSNIADVYTGNSISASVKKMKYEGISEGYDYIGTKDVGFDHQITYNNGVKIPFEESKFRHAKNGSSLLCIEGGSSGKKIGMIDRTVCFGNKLCAFVPLDVESKFLFYYLQSPQFLSIFSGSKTGIRGGVSIKKLQTMMIKVPPLAEQKSIVEKIDKLIPICDDLEQLV